MVLLDIYKEAGFFLHGHVEFRVPVLGGFLAPAVLGIKVVLASDTGQKLPVFRDFDALGERFIGLESHMCCRRIYYGFRGFLSSF
jgi:hypothetical protein